MLFHSANTDPTIQRVTARENIPESDRWDLALLYSDDTAWEKEFTALQKHYPQIGQFRGQLGKSPQRLLEAKNSVAPEVAHRRRRFFEKTTFLPLL